jgi:deoxyribodipyrimidine photolyase-like uncharacterized protein
VPAAGLRRWAEGRKELRLEHFYRWMRKRTGLLMDDGEPVGGAWNFDKDNRKPFGKRGPGRLPSRRPASRRTRSRGRSWRWWSSASRTRRAS